MARIARAAGYTTGMVAHYYESKQEIILAALRLMLLRIEQRLTREREIARGESPGRSVRSAGHRCAAVYRVRFLDGLLGPGVGGQEAQAAERLGAPGVHAPVRALLCGVLAGMAGVAADGARPGAAFGGDLHERPDGKRGHQPARLARGHAGGAAAPAIGPVAPLGQHERAARGRGEAINGFFAQR